MTTTKTGSVSEHVQELLGKIVLNSEEEAKKWKFEWSLGSPYNKRYFRYDHLYLIYDDKEVGHIMTDLPFRIAIADFIKNFYQNRYPERLKKQCPYCGHWLANG